jgi:hypothetical protein
MKTLEMPAIAGIAIKTSSSSWPPSQQPHDAVSAPERAQEEEQTHDAADGIEVGMGDVGGDRDANEDWPRRRSFIRSSKSCNRSRLITPL